MVVTAVNILFEVKLLCHLNSFSSNHMPIRNWINKYASDSLNTKEVSFSKTNWYHAMLDAINLGAIDTLR